MSNLFFHAVMLLVSIHHHGEFANGLLCVIPARPVEKPVCCNRFGNDTSNPHISQKSYVTLVWDVCAENKICPKQLGDSCGGEWDQAGKCDPSWLKCLPPRCPKNEKQCFEQQLPGHCVRINDTTKEDQDSSLNDRKVQKNHARISSPDIVPACDLIEGEKTCKCKGPAKRDKKAVELLSASKKWCFVGQIPDHHKPKKHCFEDVQWSKTAGQFWSFLAYNHTYDGKT